MIRVACVGITVMDRIYYVKDCRRRAVNTWRKIIRKLAAASGYSSSCGGQTRCAGRFYCRVGDDDTGNSLLAELESWGLTPVTPNGITRRNLRNPPSCGCQR